MTVGRIIPILNLLGTFTDQTQCVRVYFACTKKTDSLERNDYQYHQCKSLCQVRNTPFEQPTISFSLNCDQGICIFEETQTSIQNLLEMCFVQDAQTKSVFICQLTKILVSTTVKFANPALMRWIFLLGTQNQHSCGSVVMIHIALQEKRVVTTKKEEPPVLKTFFRQSQSSTPKPVPQKEEMYPLMA